MKKELLIFNYHPTDLKSKPPKSSKIFRDINNGLPNNVFIGTSHDLVNILKGGHTLIPHLMITNKRTSYLENTKLENVASSSLIIFDVDDKKFNYYKFMNESKRWGFDPCIVYESFSSSEEHRKYRLIYKFQNPILDIRIYNLSRKILQYNIATMTQGGKNYIDPSTKDINRYYLGTTQDKIIYENHESYIEPVLLVRDFISGLNLLKNKKSRDIDRLYNKMGINKEQPLISINNLKISQTYPNVEDIINNFKNFRDRNLNVNVVSDTCCLINSKMVSDFYTKKNHYIIYIVILKGVIFGNHFINPIIPYTYDCEKLKNGIFSHTFYESNDKSHIAINFDKSDNSTKKSIKYDHEIKSINYDGEFNNDELNYLSDEIKCEVFNKLKNNVEMSHHERSILFVALKPYKNGLKIYNQYQENTYTGQLDNIPFKSSFGNDKYIYPATCEHCNHDKNIMAYLKAFNNTGSSKKVIYKKYKDYSDIEGSRLDFHNKIKDVMDNPNKKINIFNIPVGVGKTESTHNLLLDNIKNKNPFVFAFGTHGKKEEIIDKPELKNNKNIFKWLKLPDFLTHQHKMEINNNRNTHRSIINTLNDYIKHEYYDKDQNVELKNYIKSIKNIYHAKHIYTTHHKALHLLDNQEINLFIFDETPEDVLFDKKQASLLEIMNFIGKANKSEDLHLKLAVKHFQNIINNFSIDGSTYKNEQPDMDSAYLFRKLNELVDIKLDTPIYDLLYSDFYKMPEDTSMINNSVNNNDIIDYVTTKEIPDKKTVIILSATPNVELYKSLYGNRVVYHEYPYIKNKGSIYQDIKKSYSKKSSISLNKKDYKFINDFIKQHNIEVTITHKFIEDSKKIKCKEINHFYNIEGLNEYSGKNLLILGTPNPPLSLIKLYHHQMYPDTDLNSIDYTFNQQLVEFDGIEFTYYTYKNERLRNIHLHLVYTELQQSIGRARLIHNKCNVYVLSNFPIYGANIVNLHTENIEFNNKTEELIEQNSSKDKNIEESNILNFNKAI